VTSRVGARSPSREQSAFRNRICQQRAASLNDDPTAKAYLRVRWTLAHLFADPRARDGQCQ